MRIFPLFVVILFGFARPLAAGVEPESEVELDPMVVNPLPVPILKIAEHPMLEPRYGSAVVADGHYLYVIGGANHEGTRLDTVERVDLETGRTQRWAKLRVARRHHRAVIVGDKIYVLGGTSGYGGKLTGELSDYAGDDPPIEDWRPPDARVMPESLLKPPKLSGAAANTRIYYESTVEIIDLATGQVTAGPRMPVAKAFFGCVAVDGRILVIGGQKEKGGQAFFTNTTEIFDPRTGQWSKGINMPTPRRCTAAVVDEFVIVIGGYSGREALKTVEMFSPRERVWHQLPPVVEGVSPSAAVWLGSYIFFFGDHRAPNRQLVYDLKRKKLAPYPLPLPYSELASAIAHDGKIYLVGGGNLRLHDAFNGIQVFVPRPEAIPAAAAPAPARR